MALVVRRVRGRLPRALVVAAEHRRHPPLAGGTRRGVGRAQEDADARVRIHGAHRRARLVPGCGRRGVAWLTRGRAARNVERRRVPARLRTAREPAPALAAAGADPHAGCDRGADGGDQRAGRGGSRPGADGKHGRGPRDRAPFVGRDPDRHARLDRRRPRRRRRNGSFRSDGLSSGRARSRRSSATRSGRCSPRWAR